MATTFWFYLWFYRLKFFYSLTYVGKPWWEEHVKGKYFLPVHLDTVEIDRGAKNMWNSLCHLSSLSSHQGWDTIFPQFSLLSQSLLWLSPIYSSMLNWEGCLNFLHPKNHYIQNSCPLKSNMLLIVQFLFIIPINLHIFYNVWLIWFDHLQWSLCYSFSESLL